MWLSSAPRTRAAAVAATFGIAAATLATAALVVQYLGDTGVGDLQETAKICHARNATSGSAASTDLQAVIDAAARGDTIRVDGACAGGFLIDKNLTLTKSAGHSRPVLDGGGTERVFTIAGTKATQITVVLRGLTITGGSAKDGAGLASTYAHVAVKASRIVGNLATLSGGGLSVDRGGLTLIKSTVVANAAGRIGGGVDVYRESRVRLGVDSVVARNSARYGGGIANDGVLKMLRTAAVRNNTARSGGGIGTYAGARSGLSGLLVMRQHASVTGNSARTCGGIQTIDFGGMNPVRIRMSGASTVSTNLGGGVCLATTALVMQGRSSVVRNRGGGILAYDAADWRVGDGDRVVIKMSDAASVSGNTGDRGAGIYLEWTGTENCATCTGAAPEVVLQDEASVTENAARVAGGGIFMNGGRLMLRNNATVLGNRPDNIVVRPRT